MAQHYTKSTVAAQEFCTKCMAMTMHRVDWGRKGPCMVCMQKAAEKAHDAVIQLIRDRQPVQLELFK